MSTIEINSSDGTAVQITDQGSNTINLTQPISSVVEVVALGPQGPVGPQGLQGMPGSITSHTNLIVTGSVWASGSNGHITSSGNISSSGYIIASSFTGSLNGTSSFSISSSLATNALTASYTPNAVVNASNEFAELTFTKGDGSTIILDAAPRRVVETVKNAESVTLPKGTPVYVSGSTGNASNVYLADAGNSSKMPAAYVLDEQLTPGAEGYGLLSGFINNVDTSTFQAGQAVYVAVGGGYTNIKPTGSALIQKLGNVIKVAQNGSGVITGAGRSNDIPNITSGYIWVGNDNQVPTPTSTASLLVNTASFALTASYVQEAISASYALVSNQATSSSYALTSDQAVSSSHALTASYVQEATSASYALTASYILNNEDLGKIIGYQLAPSDQTLTLYDGSSSSPLTNISASFITPSNGRILVELSGLRLSSNSQINLVLNRNYYIGLSSSTGSFIEVKPFKPIFSIPSDTTPDSYEISTKWIITNLTPGQSYIYYFYCYTDSPYNINSALKFSSISSQTAVIMTSLP
jgi:hypothetical protein